MKYKHVVWNYRSSGAVYAADFRFRHPVSKEEAIRYIKKSFGLERLPKEAEVWPG